MPKGSETIMTALSSESFVFTSKRYLNSGKLVVVTFNYSSNQFKIASAGSFETVAKLNEKL